MRILFLMRLFYPHIGGVERHVVEVAKRLAKLGHEVSVVSETPQSSIKYIKTYEIPVGRNEKFKKFQIWWWLWENRNLIKEADIVHAHDVGFWYFPFRFLYPRKPFYITFHGYEQYPPKKGQILIRKISEKLSWGNICVGDYIPKWYGTKATYTIYGGVEILPILQINTNTTNNKNILFIGRLDEQTGIMTYLRVLKIFKEKGIKLTLIVCGDGPLREKIEKYIQENKLDVRILGFIANPEKYLPKARFAFVSRYLSILEAMVAKKLVFATFDNPLKEDYLKLSPFSKWIIIEDSPEGLYNKLVYYTKNPAEEEKLIDQAYNWAKKQTWEKVVELYLKLWGVK